VIVPADLLERGKELDTLDACLDQVQRAARGLVVLLGGEAGVGKSAVVRRFCDEHLSSATILCGDCDPLFTPRPLGPLLAVAETTGGDLARVVESGGQPHEVAASLARELHARSPSIFVLEDVHWG
jgi:predicted ATPase